MSASFRQLSSLLSEFELEQFNLLCAKRLGGIPEGVAHGGVQFVSIEPGIGTTRAVERSCATDGACGRVQGKMQKVLSRVVIGRVLQRKCGRISC